MGLSTTGLITAKRGQNIVANNLTIGGGTAGISA